MSIITQYQKPIGFGLITTLNHQQALERTGGKHGHKGVEAAETVLQQLIAYQNL
jgi:6,7-dimethyl-8-ribityllumazine synthase